MTALALDKVPMQRLDMDPMPDPDRIPTDLFAARAAYDELGKALDTGDYSPPESRAWKYRAANTMKRFMGALGWSVGGADPRVQTLAAALREACTSPCSPARYRELLKLADEADAP